MSSASSKQIATAFLEHLSAAAPDRALALVHPDASWEIVGQREVSGFTGSYDKRKLEKLMRQMYSQLEHGLVFEVSSAIAEGDEVAVEASSRGDLKNGRKYRQRYHFRFGIRGEQIVSAREYLDTHHAWDVWVRP